MKKSMKPKTRTKKKTKKAKKSDPLNLEIPDFAELDSFFDELERIDKELERALEIDLSDFDITP